MKKIGLLTSGGDAPGMNAVIRAVTRKALAEGLQVVGIQRGYEGLLARSFRNLDARDVGNIVNRGGTMLKTARCVSFRDEAMQEKAVEILREEGIEGLVVVGGDGSMRGAQCLAALGMPTVTVPGTIDNDMPGTEYTIGFDTAVNTVVDAVSKIRDTTTAHDRVAIVEVMGRHAGHIAVDAGLACGAEIVLIPEWPTPLEVVCNHLMATHRAGKRYSIIIVAEGAYSGHEVYEYIKEHSDVSPNVTVLGYLQRGGSPSARDGMMAALMSEKAVDCLVKEGGNALIGYINSMVVATAYEDVQYCKFSVDSHKMDLVALLSQ